MSESLQRIEPAPESFGVMVQRAIDKGVPVETMERLLAMYEKLQARQAKAEFDRALAAFQAECPTIQKTKKVMNKDGRSVRYQYAPLEVIVQQVKGLLEKNGFSYTVDAEVEPGLVRATCKATHQAGHSQTSSFSVPIDKDAYMNPAQQCASALTFAKRYAFCNAFGILTGDEDDDSQASHEPTDVQQSTKPALKSSPKAATTKTRDWFLAEMRKRFSDATLLQWGIDHTEPTYLLPTEHLEDWPLAQIPTSKVKLQAMIQECAEFMGVTPSEQSQKAQDAPADTPTPPKPQSAIASQPEGKATALRGSEPERDYEPSQDDPGGPTEDGAETVVGKLEAVSEKNGRSSKGPWTRWGIRIGPDVWLNTFNGTLAACAKQDKGHTVKCHFRRGDKGNELISIERAKKN